MSGIEPSIPVPQTGVLPLNYGHHILAPPAIANALVRIRTRNPWSEAKCDIHFTTRAQAMAGGGCISPKLTNKPWFTCPQSHLRGSNSGPMLYESIALPAELRWLELWLIGRYHHSTTQLCEAIAVVYNPITKNTLIIPKNKPTPKIPKLYL